MARHTRIMSSSSSEPDQSELSDDEALISVRRPKLCNIEDSTSENDEESSDSSDEAVKPSRSRRHCTISSDQSSDSDQVVVNPKARRRHVVSEDSSTSDDGDDGDVCQICLNKFRNQDLGTPESCDHTFCLDCLEIWSKRVNTCPVDRGVFRLILARHAGSQTVYRKIPVTDMWVDDEALTDLTYCEVCQRPDREHRMLLCDECDAGYHCECLDPPLEDIPADEWFCPNCLASMIYQSSSESEASDERFAVDDDTDDVLSPRRRITGHSPAGRRVPRTRLFERVRAAVNESRRNRRRVVSSEDSSDLSLPPNEPQLDTDDVSLSGTPGMSEESPHPAARSVSQRGQKRKAIPTSKSAKKRKSSKKTKLKKKTKSVKSNRRRSKNTKRKRRSKKKRKRVKLKATDTPLSPSPKSRIAKRLGLYAPLRGTTIPRQKSLMAPSLDVQRSNIGVESLSIVGNGLDLIPRNESKYSRSSADSRQPIAEPSCSTTPAEYKGKIKADNCDILGSILKEQSKLSMSGRHILIGRDGTLNAASQFHDRDKVKSTSKALNSRLPGKNKPSSDGQNGCVSSFNHHKTDKDPLESIINGALLTRGSLGHDRHDADVSESPSSHPQSQLGLNADCRKHMSGILQVDKNKQDLVRSEESRTKAPTGGSVQLKSTTGDRFLIASTSKNVTPYIDFFDLTPVSQSSGNYSKHYDSVVKSRKSKCGQPDSPSVNHERYASPHHAYSQYHSGVCKTPLSDALNKHYYPDRNSLHDHPVKDGQHNGPFPHPPPNSHSSPAPEYSPSINENSLNGESPGSYVSTNSHEVDDAKIHDDNKRGLSTSVANGQESSWSGSSSLSPEDTLKADAQKCASREIHEKIVQFSKKALKPHYKKSVISKDEYKEILRKVVHKVWKRPSFDIKEAKIQDLVNSYVDISVSKKKKRAKDVVKRTDFKPR